MRRLFLIALALTILLPLLAVMLVFLAAAGESAAQCGTAFAGASGPVGGVPPADVPIFEGAAAQFGLGARGPSILAAINYVESTFGQSNDAGVHSGANYAGAMGPMQFLQGTWDTYKVQAPGGAVPPNVYDEADAVYSAANYLKASGAPGDWPGAIFAYNHSSAYVQQVLSQAAGYYTQGLTAQGPPASTPTSGSALGDLGRPVQRSGGDRRPGRADHARARAADDRRRDLLHRRAPARGATTCIVNARQLRGAVPRDPRVAGDQAERDDARRASVHDAAAGDQPAERAQRDPLQARHRRRPATVKHAGRLPLPDRPDRVGRSAARPTRLGAGAAHAVDRPGEHARRRPGVLGQLGVRVGGFRPRSDPRVHDRPRRHGRRRERSGRHPDLRAAGQPAGRSGQRLVPGTPTPDMPQPLLLFRFLNRPAGAPSAYWYVAEEITPVSTTVGTIFRARQAVARFAPSGTGIEIGWGSPTSSGRTLAQQMGDSAAANPPAGAQTTWGESFKHFFGIH